MSDEAFAYLCPPRRCAWFMRETNRQCEGVPAYVLRHESGAEIEFCASCAFEVEKDLRAGEVRYRGLAVTAQEVTIQSLAD